VSRLAVDVPGGPHSPPNPRGALGGRDGWLLRVASRRGITDSLRGTDHSHLCCRFASSRVRVMPAQVQVGGVRLNATVRTRTHQTGTVHYDE
jgi:hypothetical protein